MQCDRRHVECLLLVGKWSEKGRGNQGGDNAEKGTVPGRGAAAVRHGAGGDQDEKGSFGGYTEDHPSFLRRLGGEERPPRESQPARPQGLRAEGGGRERSPEPGLALVLDGASSDPSAGGAVDEGAGGDGDGGGDAATGRSPSISSIIRGRTTFPSSPGERLFPGASCI